MQTFKYEIIEYPNIIFIYISLDYNELKVKHNKLEKYLILILL